VNYYGRLLRAMDTIDGRLLRAMDTIEPDEGSPEALEVQAQREAEVIQLCEGYTLQAWEYEGSYYLLPVAKDDRPRRRRPSAVQVVPPLPPRRSWHGPWSEQTDDPEYGYINYDSYRHMSAAEARALGEVLALAASLVEALDREKADELTEQARKREAYLRQKIQEEEAKEQHRLKLKEDVQWYIGQKFKLRRKGYRATVFGVIDRITDTTIFTISERGVRMTIDLESLEELHIMYEGEKRYTKVFPN
jgi:cell division septum initiation protein DivIVA